MPPFSFILQVLHLQVSHDVFTQSPPRMKRGFPCPFQPLKALILGHFRDWDFTNYQLHLIILFFILIHVEIFTHITLK